MTALVLTPEPIGPGDDAMLRQVLDIKLRRMRVVPFGLIRINLGQEAMAMAVNSSPDDLFTESGRLADALCAALPALRATHRSLKTNGMKASRMFDVIRHPI